MEFQNKNGNIIQQDFIAGTFDLKKIKKIIQNDETPLPAGFPKLWYNVYAGHVYITNLTGVVLKKYKM